MDIFVAEELVFSIRGELLDLDNQLSDFYRLKLQTVVCVESGDLAREVDLTHKLVHNFRCFIYQLLYQYVFDKEGASFALYGSERLWNLFESDPGRTTSFEEEIEKLSLNPTSRFQKRCFFELNWNDFTLAAALAQKRLELREKFVLLLARVLRTTGEGILSRTFFYYLVDRFRFGVTGLPPQSQNSVAESQSRPSRSQRRPETEGLP